MTTLQDRATIDQLARLGYTDRQIAEQVGWEIPTVRKWRRRAQACGRKGLASKMGRPKTGALSTFPALIRETLRAWRKGIAEARNVEPDVILSNDTLMALARRAPRNAKALDKVDALDEWQRKTYGDEILRVLND